MNLEHEILKSEIEAKEEDFKDLVSASQEMETSSNPFIDEVVSKQAHVLREREGLHMAWQQKKVYLDQLLDLHFFLRDTKQILAFYGGQERIVNRTVNIEDTEAIEKELKFFETNQVCAITRDYILLAFRKKMYNLPRGQINVLPSSSSCVLSSNFLLFFSEP